MEDKKLAAVFRRFRFSSIYDILIYESSTTSYYVEGKHYLKDGEVDVTYKKNYCENSDYIYKVLKDEEELFKILEIVSFNTGVSFILDKIAEEIIIFHEEYEFEEYVFKNDNSIESVFPEAEYRVEPKKEVETVNEETNKVSEKKEEVKKLEDTKEKLLNIKALESKLLSTVKGQDEQIKNIISAMYGHFYLGLKNNMLIMGPSGVGKTYILEQIAQNLDIPYFIEDATQYTAEGYVGKSVNEMLVHLLHASGDDVKKAQNGILIIDEIDKKGGDSKGSSEVNKKDVLTSLLSILQGRIINVEISRYEKIDFDTSKLMIVLLGAFTDIRETKESQSVGFNKKIVVNGTRESKVDYDKLKSYGMTDEFMGRIEILIELNELTEENLYQILTNENCSLYDVYYNACNSKNISLEISEAVSRSIVKEAMKMNTGARALKKLVNQLFLPLTYELFVEEQTSIGTITASELKYENGNLKIEFIKEKAQVRKKVKDNWFFL